ncbi:low molecular weight phosphatase family protein [Actinoplanes sp. NPDC049265]|uniref:arsenate reductase/protein-tyrosine-phosphatase family protein n=1 Tax=Actinoplanes sp. NPDC049265 TaxID=3363902 RepID=UPI003724010A
MCHANLCRSPMAERLARRAFDDAFGAAGREVVTTSAGIRGFDGGPMHRFTADVLSECGADSRDFTSRTVDSKLLMDADLVLTATREQRTACLTLEPGAVRRAFTLKQFARFAAPLKSDGLGLLVDEVNLTRHRAPTVPDDHEDLADPMGRPIEAFRACAEDIWRCLRTVINAVT